MDRETFGLLQGKFDAERAHNFKYQPARMKLLLLSHTTYSMSTKIVPQYLYIHLNQRSPAERARPTQEPSSYHQRSRWSLIVGDNQTMSRELFHKRGPLKSSLSGDGSFI